MNYDTEASLRGQILDSAVHSLLPERFAHLRPYFDGLTLGDLSHLSPQELEACASPQDSLHMKIFVRQQLRPYLKHKDDPFRIDE